VSFRISFSYGRKPDGSESGAATPDADRANWANKSLDGLAANQVYSATTIIPGDTNTLMYNVT
jgi:hypothetical protein